MSSTLTQPEVTVIQRHLKAAMIALDNCMQPDLSEEVKVVFKHVADRAYGNPAYMPDAAHWYDSHENLHTLAEWLREHRGWDFCKDNLLDVIETPWSWEKEWRLASGDVDFKLVERPRSYEDDPLPGVFHIDSTECAWCDAQVGFVLYISQGIPGVDDRNEVEWVTTYIDIKSEDLACDDCAGSASNFKETTQS